MAALVGWQLSQGAVPIWGPAIVGTQVLALWQHLLNDLSSLGGRHQWVAVIIEGTVFAELLSFTL